MEKKPGKEAGKRSADRSKEVPAPFGSEALKEMPSSEALKEMPSSEALKETLSSEALRACTSFDYFICNIPVVICKLDLVFFFNQIVNRRLKKNKNKKFALAGTWIQLLRPYRQMIYVRELLAGQIASTARKKD